MVTGELKRRIDALWTEFWQGGITNPLTVIEQITFLMYARLLDITRPAMRTGRSALGNRSNGGLRKMSSDCAGPTFDTPRLRKSSRWYGTRSFRTLRQQQQAGPLSPSS